MPGPVVIDDGGSIQIEEVDGELDKLLMVDPSPHAHKSSDLTGGKYTHIAVSCMDLTGAVKQLVPLSLNTNFEVFAGQIRVEGKVIATGECEITVHGVGGVNPEVKIKHRKKQQTLVETYRKKYVVTNALEIEKVKINTTDYEIPDDTTYTAVILS